MLRIVGRKMVSVHTLGPGQTGASAKADEILNGAATPALMTANFVTAEPAVNSSDWDSNITQLLEQRDRLLLEIVALRRRNAALVGLAARLHAELGSLRRSTSWRVSAPLRGLKLGVSRLGRMADAWKARLQRRSKPSDEIMIEPHPESLAAWREMIKRRA